MAYTALYRRFRPQLFSELVGQEHISRTLAAAVRQGSFVHAYLFCGPRGTGKTSTARILARAVNCQSPTKEGEPCGACPACLRSLQGESLDILEIDAASNRGIDEIRDLRERVKYAPALEKYKVYIIDEAHMLTGPAANAFLKTLEEPPPHVLFMLATTEPHKMPLTVLSRCQRFDFRRVSEAATAAHLAAVAQAEGYSAEPEALLLIARKAEGGMRDALGLLDQCAGFSGGRISVEALNRLTGTVDSGFIETMTRHMLAGNTAELLHMVAALHEEGRDLRQFLRDLLEYQRELLLSILSPAANSAPLWAREAGAGPLVRLLRELSASDGSLRHSLQPRLTLELALLAACGLPEVQPTPQTESPRRSAPPPFSKGGQEDGADVDELERLRELWPQVVQAVGKKNASAGPMLAKAQPLSLHKEQLTLSFPAALFMNKICRPGAYRELTEQSIAALFGRKLSIKGEIKQEEEIPPPSEAPPSGEQGSLF